jgi:hypothetical protein
VRTLGESSDAEDGDNESGSQLNTWAYERYFDKPEVIRAYREQQLIQTPEYTLLSEHEAVGGRFRPRSLDDVRAYRAAQFFFKFFQYKLTTGNHYRKASTRPMGLMKSGIASTRHSRRGNVYEKRRS